MLSCCFPAEEPERFEPEPLIELSPKHKGAGVTLNGRMVSGSGSVFADSPLLQDKGYFEATVVSCGTFAIGVATRDTDLEGVLTEKVSVACAMKKLAGSVVCDAVLTVSACLETGRHSMDCH